jgi:hypothetical protein
MGDSFTHCRGSGSCGRICIILTDPDPDRYQFQFHFFSRKVQYTTIENYEPYNEYEKDLKI